MEPMKLIRTLSTVVDQSQTSAQKVKQSSLVNHANFFEEQRVYQHPRSGLGTCTGSFIREEEMPNSFTNDNRTKVGSSSTRQAEFVEAPVSV